MIGSEQNPGNGMNVMFPTSHDKNVPFCVWLIRFVNIILSLVLSGYVFRVSILVFSNVTATKQNRIFFLVFDLVPLSQKQNWEFLMS